MSNQLLSPRSPRSLNKLKNIELRNKGCGINLDLQDIQKSNTSKNYKSLKINDKIKKILKND